MGRVLTIREMKSGDVVRAADAVQRGGWGDRAAFFEFAVRTPACSPFLAEDAGEIVATGVGTANGPVGWVGMIWTAPAHRGRGLGRAMTERVMDDLAARGCPTLLLDASELGRPIYVRLGFEPVGRDLRFGSAGNEGTGTGARRDAARLAEPRVRRIEARDLNAAAALDRAATGEDRRHLIEASITDGLAVDGPDGQLAGFLLAPAFGGPAVIARDEEAATALIRTRRTTTASARGLDLALPEANTGAVGALLGAGWAERSGPLRMVRGPLPPWQPAWIWGVFSFATG